MHRRKGVYIRIVFILIFGVWFSVGCGRSPAEQKAEYYEVRSQGKEPLEIRRSGVFLEMQYCGGEPVQLWTDDGNTIYIARTDGSRELIMKNAGGTGSREWFVDREEAVYSWKKRKRESSANWILKGRRFTAGAWEREWRRRIYASWMMEAS